MSDTNAIFDNSNYMTINALEDGVEIVYGSSCEYGINGVGWYKYHTNRVIILNSGESVSFRNISNKSEQFNIKGQCGLSGNVMSLLFGDNAKNNKNLTGYPMAFNLLFARCTGIQFVSSNFLPATTLADRCYYHMFEGCRSLTTAPELPATTLAISCYNSMFMNCTSLTTAPELPATTLEGGCYDSMFNGCTSLTTAPELPATTLAGSCYNSMFEGCTSLKIAPALPATTLAARCYNSMFRNCTKLNYIKMLATDISATWCLYNWVYSVASSGTFVKNPEATWDVVGDSGVPSGWTVKFDGEEDDGIETTLQFPLYLNFDYCEENVLSVYCYGNGDYAELNRVIKFVVDTYGVDDAIHYRSVNEAKLDELGLEIYLEGEKVRSFAIEYSECFVNTDTYYATKVTDSAITYEY